MNKNVTLQFIEKNILFLMNVEDWKHRGNVNFNLNKNAFQWDAYHPLQWPSLLQHTSPFPRHAHPPAKRPLPRVNRITDACENITLPQLRCGR